MRLRSIGESLFENIFYIIFILAMPLMSPVVNDRPPLELQHFIIEDLQWLLLFQRINLADMRK